MNRLKTFLLLLAVLCALSCATGTGPTATADAEPWKFAVFCDTRGNNDQTTQGKACVNVPILERIAQDIVDEGCELVIVPGDLVNGWWANGGMDYPEQFATWKKAMAAVYQNNIPVYTVRGNHEAGPGKQYPAVPPYDIVPDDKLKACYLEAFGPDNPQNGPDGEKGLTYFVVHRNALFVGFDAYINPNRINLDWFKYVLQNRDAIEAPHLFAYSHCPAYQVVHPDCLAYYTSQRDAFWNLMAENGGRIYFSGHDHMYNRAAVTADNGIDVLQAVVGSCGAPFKDWQPPYKDPKVQGRFHDETHYGYMVVTVEGDKLSAKWKALAQGGGLPWTTKDSFSASLR